MGIGGPDITEGHEKFILAIVWQLMRCCEGLLCIGVHWCLLLLPVMLWWVFAVVGVCCGWCLLWLMFAVVDVRCG